MCVEKANVKYSLKIECLSKNEDCRTSNICWKTQMIAEQIEYESNNRMFVGQNSSNVCRTNE